MQKNKLQKLYAWLGFVVFWSVVVFILWSMIWNEEAVEDDGVDTLCEDIKEIINRNEGNV